MKTLLVGIAWGLLCLSFVAAAYAPGRALAYGLAYTAFFVLWAVVLVSQD